MPVYTVDGDTGMEYLLSVLKDSDIFSSDELYKKHFEAVSYTHLTLPTNREV